MSSSVIERIGGLSSNRRLKLIPIFVAPFLSRFKKSIQSRCVQRRSPLIFLPIRSSVSEHGPQSPKHFEQVLLVYASGVGATKNRFDNFRISPTPMQLGLPLLQAAPGLPAIMPQEPYAKTSGRSSVFNDCSLLYSRSSLCCVLTEVFHRRLR